MSMVGGGEVDLSLAMECLQSELESRQQSELIAIVDRYRDLLRNQSWAHSAVSPKWDACTIVECNVRPASLLVISYNLFSLIWFFQTVHGIDRLLNCYKSLQLYLTHSLEKLWKIILQPCFNVESYRYFRKESRHIKLKKKLFNCQ